ncbi:acetyl-CoA synthetase-like protein [Amylostereum chailletii]|nr:acetyl-CoA synthetase-like protein [Amylostereum chailletii]
MLTPYLSSLATLQGPQNPTFTHPPINLDDHDPTIPQLFAHHALNSPRHPLFVYANEDGATQTIAYEEAHLAIRRAAHIVLEHFKTLEGHYAEQQQSKTDGHPPTIGILSVADSITTFTTMVGIMHSGFTPFPISTRNSPTAIAHVIRNTGILQLFVSPDPAMQRLGQQTVEVLAKDGYVVQVLPMPQFPDLYDENGGELEGAQPRPMDMDHPVLILHTSGSTSFPKPIKMTNRNFLRWGLVIWNGQVDLCGNRLAAHSLPLFHAMGAIQIVWTTCVGIVMACFKPANPPVLPTPETFLTAIDATKCEIVYCVPAFVEAWARSPENFDVMKRIKAIVFGGAPMNKKVGDELIDLGVILVPFYGSTEAGAISMTIPASPSKDNWEYFKISPHLDSAMIPQEGMAGICEPVILASPKFSPNVTNTVLHDVPAFASNDLLQEHPTQPGFWRVFGRVDDQLTLSTGEKTNPVPLESIFIQDPRILAAIMFGRGRFQNGILIQPKELFDPTDEALLTKFRNDIWPTVIKVNEHAPTHSRIFKEMIMVTRPNKLMEFTPKGTPRRHVSLRSYDQEIDALYDAVKDSSQVEYAPPALWTPTTTKEFVGDSVRRVVQVPLTDNDDIFQYGCDSLQATWIRNTIMHALRVSTETPLHAIPHGFVYSHPTICSLSDFVYNVITDHMLPHDEAAEAAARANAMNAMVAKYQIQVLGSPRVDSPEPDGATVLLTGSTGRLGCHLLAQLASDPTVKRVFALNRDAFGGASDPQARQAEAFKKWGLEVDLLSEDKITLVGCEYGRPRLGLDESTYSEISNSVTSIIHNAWRVDFNVGLGAFESLIASLKDLVDLASRSPAPGGAHILFVSSVSVAFNHPSGDSVHEVPLEDARIAAGFGYGESKWVAEQVLFGARQERNLKVTVVRVGQLSGDTRIGGWNTKEWVPALLSVSKQVGALPARSGTVSWVPVDVAASVLLEMAHSSSPVLHLISPHPAQWNAIFSAFGKQLGLPLLPYAEWLARVQTVVSSPSQDHTSAHSLVEFFKMGVFGEDISFSTIRAVQASRALAEMRPLGHEDALSYLKYWEKLAFI